MAKCGLLTELIPQFGLMLGDHGNNSMATGRPFCSDVVTSSIDDTSEAAHVHAPSFREEYGKHTEDFSTKRFVSSNALPMGQLTGIRLYRHAVKTIEECESMDLDYEHPMSLRVTLSDKTTALSVRQPIAQTEIIPIITRRSRNYDATAAFYGSSLRPGAAVHR